MHRNESETRAYRKVYERSVARSGPRGDAEGESGRLGRCGVAVGARRRRRLLGLEVLGVVGRVERAELQARQVAVLHRVRHRHRVAEARRRSHRCVLVAMRHRSCNRSSHYILLVHVICTCCSYQTPFQESIVLYFV